MTQRTLAFRRRLLHTTLWAASLPVVLLMAAQSGNSQASSEAGPYERTYRQSKSAVERALKELQPSMSGRLPALEGFALAGDHPLNRYQRAYYQSVRMAGSNPIFWTS